MRYLWVTSVPVACTLLLATPAPARTCAAATTALPATVCRADRDRNARDVAVTWGTALALLCSAGIAGGQAARRRSARAVLS
ncbi:hypothetical protein FHS99_002191 [Sphingomonas prati]|uniref:Uncharacterized protein n=2 Tax=Sphingomonas prati TaxID=1843237 RepID=A0A7W9F3N3_9SPHN|nr:hypothetical protein [Sphingomonas prati]MBB5729695.1 hypothetical protein [Sphingomonas prati]